MSKRHYEASTLIDAPIASVWRLLTSVEELKRWDSGIVRIEGSLAVGKKMKIFSEPSPEKGFTVRVERLDKEDRMVWKGGMPMGLFTGLRTFRVREKELKTHFFVFEEFSGPLAPWILPSIPDLEPQFRRFAQGLKRRAEKDAMVR